MTAAVAEAGLGADDATEVADVDAVGAGSVADVVGAWSALVLVLLLLLLQPAAVVSAATPKQAAVILPSLCEIMDSPVVDGHSDSAAGRNDICRCVRPVVAGLATGNCR